MTYLIIINATSGYWTMIIKIITVCFRIEILGYTLF